MYGAIFRSCREIMQQGELGAVKSIAELKPTFLCHVRHVLVSEARYDKTVAELFNFGKIL